MLRDNHDLQTGIVAANFDAEALAKICALPESTFGREFDLRRFSTRDRSAIRGEDYWFHKDNGSSVLAMAHLDTVMPAHRREARFVNTEAGPVIYSGALDDRLGAYIILDLLPKMGMNYDLLLTVGEESGGSTAQFFEPAKQYDWMIEFDRGGTDVVMYQYDDSEVRDMVRATGADVGNGIFSDICYLDHLNIKGFNWGVGYRDYHGPRSHAYLNDTIEMVAHYALFHEQNEGTYMPHDRRSGGFGWGRSSWAQYERDEYEIDGFRLNNYGEWVPIEEWDDTFDVAYDEDAAEAIG